VKISSDCKLGKECLGFTFSPLAKPDKKWEKNPPVIVHHNYIKGNIEKVGSASSVAHPPMIVHSKDGIYDENGILCWDAFNFQFKSIRRMQSSTCPIGH
jgi:hypothetical protein